ncbi:hypothetical protein AURDEDRAFT_184651 [Auricularia subglabra TFB-10046 SS5]|nr:hypothetical protein AURDEDRAFT_184651 [Auricularia subglabra TFB-10046 SS5]
MAPPKTQRSVLTEGVFLGALLVLVVATVPTVFSFASSAALSKQVPTATAPAGTIERQPRTPLLASLLAATPILRLVLSAFISSLRLLLAPVLFLLNLVLALLAPLILVVKTTLHIFVVVPYTILVAILSLLYPIYMFCATACLVGVMLAFGGSLVQRLVGVLLGTQARAPKQQLHTPPPARRVTYKGQRSL